MADTTLEILLQAKNQSEAAFKELKTQLNSLQQEIAKTRQATEQGFNFDKAKAQIVGFGAAVYGAFKAIGQAVDMAEFGSKLEKQSAAFTNLADAAGTSSGRLLDSLKSVSKGMVSEAELMQASGKALLMGIPAAEITKLMEIAAATSRMTGQSVTEAFNDITMGVARQSRMILDNLGIIVNVDKANEDYARRLGKTADALSDAEKRQAFMNAVMKAGEDMIKRLGSSHGALEGANKLVAAQSDLWNEVNKSIANILDGSLSKFARELNWIEAKLKGMRESTPKEDKQREWNNIERTRASERFGLVEPGTADRMLEDFNRKYVSQQYGLKPSEELKRTGSFSTPAWNPAGWREREGNYAPNTEEQNKAILKQQEEERKAIEKEFEDYMKSDSGIVSYGAWEEDQQRLELLRQELIKTSAAAQQFNMELYKKAAEGDTRRLEKEIPFLQKEGLDEKINDVVESVGNGFDELTKLSERTAEAMQQNFSDLFFDAMTGKLKSLTDYFNAIMTSIQRAAADMLGQLLTQKLFGAGSTGPSGQSGGQSGAGWLSQGVGWVSGLVSAYGGGGSGSTPSGWVNAWTHHAGGMVDGTGPRRQVPSWVFAGAPRLHGGLAADEFPAILQRGEEVRTREQARRSAANITINVQSANGRLERDSLTHLQTALYTSLQRAGQRNA